MLSEKRRRRFLPAWSLPAFCWSLIGASLFLLLTLLVLRVAEFGPYGLALFLAALAVILGRGAVLAVPHARRVKPRFSLRTLLIMTAIGGIGLAGLGHWLRDFQQQQAALERARKRGFTFGIADGPLPGFMYRRFGLRGVIAVRGLGEIGKFNTDITADDLESLRGLRCRGVFLNASTVSDDELTHLLLTTGQVEFGADRTGIGDKSLEHLSQFHQLESLSLGGTKVTNEGVAYLTRLPRLHTLSLIGSPITDAAIPHLKSMQQLRILYVSSLSPEGIAELRKALPNCKIP